MSVQNLLNAAIDPKKMVGLVKQGDGKTIATATATIDKPVSIRLPTVKKNKDYWKFMENLLEKLMCCKNFYSREPLQRCLQCQDLEKNEVLPTVGVKSGTAFPQDKFKLLKLLF